MSTKMSVEEREAFLADLHVGVLSVEQEGRGPLTVPVWYMYEKGGDLWFLTDKESMKGRCLEKASRISLCAQTETAPYKYVSVEGPIISRDLGTTEDHSRPMAHRYLGPQMGDDYVAGNADAPPSTRYVMRPERWLTVDYGKLFEGAS